MANIYKVVEASKYTDVVEYDTTLEDIDGVILRAGYRGYGGSGSLVTDSLFEKHYTGFSSVELETQRKIGVYWFTQATSETEAIEEANYLYTLIKRKEISFPIYLNIGYGSSSKNGRADNLSASDRTDYAISFLDKIVSIGYKAGIYTTKEWLDNHLEYDRLKDKGYSIWIANGEKPLDIEIDAYAYTTIGHILGITGSVTISEFYNNVADWSNVVNISKMEANIEYDTIIYSGEPNTPVVTIEGLVQDKDFTVDYHENIEVGTASIVIMGIINYNGTIEKKFEITPQSITDKSIEVSPIAFSYDGEKHLPTAIIYNNIGTQLIENEDFIISLVKGSDEPILIGDYFIDIEGINNYSGKVTRNFSIIAKSIKEYNFRLENNAFKYTGEEIRPEVFVDNLVKDEDYIVRYYDNIERGTARVVITGINNYGSSKTIEFEISDMTINMFDYYLEPSSFIYDGVEHKPKVYVDGLTEGIDFEVDFQNDLISAGVVHLYIRGTKDYSGIIDATYNINSKSIGDMELELDNYLYPFRGYEVKPVPKLGNLIEDTDYTLVYFNNFDPGIAKITANGIGNYTGTISIDFEIGTKDMVDCIGKLGYPTVKSYYRVRGPLRIYADKQAYEDDMPLINNVNYIITDTNTEVKKDYTVETYSIKGLGSITGSFDFVFYVIDQEPLRPIDYTDDGVYNFGDIDEGDETAEGDYNFQDADNPEPYKPSSGNNTNGDNDGDNTGDGTGGGGSGSNGDHGWDFDFGDEGYDPVFGEKSMPEDQGIAAHDEDDDESIDSVIPDDDTEEPIIPPDSSDGDENDDPEPEPEPEPPSGDEPKVADGEDYDFDYLSTMYIAEYDEDTGKNEYKKQEEEDKYPDDGKYNFGDIDEGDETAEGDYDFGDLDEGVDEDNVANGDYDFNKFAYDEEGEDDDFYIAPGTEFELDDTPIYATHCAPTSSCLKSGIYYVHEGHVVNNRVRLTKYEDSVLEPERLTGWADVDVLMSLGKFVVGDEVVVNGNIFKFANGAGGWTRKTNETMYVVDLLPDNQYPYPYGLASTSTSTRLGFADIEALSKPDKKKKKKK